MPRACVFVGFRTSYEALLKYRTDHELSISGSWTATLRKLHEVVGVPLAIVVVDKLRGQQDDYYIACFADCGCIYKPKTLLEVPVPPTFLKLPHALQVEDEEVQRLFAPFTSVWPYHGDGKIEQLPVGTTRPSLAHL